MPPPLPGCSPTDFATQSRLQEDAFGDDYRSLDAPVAGFAALDGLLKHPARIAYELCEGTRRGPVAMQMLAIMTVGFLAYGVLMGLFGGGSQIWRVPLKVAGGLVASALLCLPSLYIFASLAGTGLSGPRLAALLFEALALAGLLLCGFLPVAWVFSQSTSSIAFMGFLHLIFVACALLLGLRLLRKTLCHFHRRAAGWTLMWSAVLLLVVLQMATALRPLVGPAGSGDALPEKMFFLQHWFLTVNGGSVW